MTTTQVLTTKTIDNSLSDSSELPLQNKVVKQNLDSKQNKINALPAQIFYGTGVNGTVSSKELMESDGLVVTNEPDFIECKSKALTFKKVYNEWGRFNTDTSSVPNWYYESTEKTIVQTVNTNGLVGFISSDNYSNYDITVRCYSSYSDNDSIGLVAAYAVDSSNKIHEISFIRTTGGTGPEWSCKLDFTKVSYSRTHDNVADCLAYLANKSLTAVGNNQDWNAASNADGTVIRMKRTGNKITAWCSQFNSRELDENTKIEIDLDTITDNPEIINLFKGSSKWGFCNASQPYSKYQILSGINLDQKIYEFIDGNNNYWYYDSNTDTWKTDTTKSPYDILGGSRLSYNEITKKLFYSTGTKIYQIGSVVS